MNRRTFIQSTLAVGAFSTVNLQLRGEDKVVRKYRTALIGAGWWGGNIVGEAMASGQCEIVGACDADSRAIERTREKITQLSGDQPRGYRDYRELLAKEKPDIVIVATPDHWHALPTIAAVRAGAHVYVEKPTAHTIAESQAMVKAARACASRDSPAHVGPHDQRTRLYPLRPPR